ncbi:hypothetical protein JOD57_001895 [Geodermatophilus bullaregiensis]|uniref:hypothetical protein n=1 Tax=Geodermatophilus bullaregiensis TaxID=1564160 RepID=UPI00195E442D|nr:hypothetical protein [Geodermatophilus bullaregiensis]MBM7806058.1 hypothetical protein [Geodermatophilus bullaregiensis]
MGRHAAADDAGTDPIIAAALASKADAPGTRRATGLRDADDRGREGSGNGLGWPGDTTTGGGLGWPGSADTAEGTGAGTVDETARMDAVPPVPAPGPEDEPEPPGPRGWRRLFGGHAA